MATRPPSNSNSDNRANNRAGQEIVPSGKRTYQPPPPPKFFSPSPAEQEQGGKSKRGKTKFKAEKAVFSPQKRAVAPTKPKKGGRGFTIAMIGVGLVALIVLVGLFVGSRLFNFLDGISVPRVDANGNAVSGSNVGGSGKVNILLLGLDTRGAINNDGIRSDTMIVVSIDQSKKTASMLSIPRDLWVEIPGHGNNRINTSYFFGDQDKPGAGGPPLAKQTVERNFGIPIHYFVQVDFGGFRQIIDAIGGVTIDVKKPLIDAQFPTEDFGYKRIFIPAGLQRLDGKTALEYARSRHADSDLGRNQRQQEVLLAIREQGVNLGLLTNNELQTALQGAIKTDLNTGDILGLAQLAIGLNKANIRSFSIDANVASQANIDGNDVLKPDWAAIRQLVREFQDSVNTPAVTAAAVTSPRAEPNPPENASISVLNGTFTDKLASRTQIFLQTKGFKIDNIDQADDAGNYPNSIILVYTGKKQTAQELAKVLGLPATSIKEKKDGPKGIDIQIICGQDLTLPQGT